MSLCLLKPFPLQFEHGAADFGFGTDKESFAAHMGKLIHHYEQIGFKVLELESGFETKTKESFLWRWNGYVSPSLQEFVQ